MSYRSHFSKALLREQMRRRALAEHGDRAAHTSPLWPDWRSNLHPALLAPAEARVADGSLPLHDYAPALNSSQAFAMNLFLPLAGGDSGAFSDFLRAELGVDVVVESVDLEFFGSGDLLAEIPRAEPGPDDKLTAADVAIHLRDADDRRGVLLVEVKLSEGGFTSCGGVDSRGNRDRAPCLDAALFFREPDRCYLRRPYRAQRDRRYWRIFDAAHGSLRDAFPGRSAAGGCPFAGSWTSGTWRSSTTTTTPTCRSRGTSTVGRRRTGNSCTGGPPRRCFLLSARHRGQRTTNPGCGLATCSTERRRSEL